MSQELAIFGGTPTRSELLPYGHQWIDDSEIKEVSKVLKSDWITQGSKVNEFEDKIAKYVQTKFAIVFNSGTSALHAACYAAGINPGDEAITTPMTFVATANCVLYQGGIPVFADIKIDDLNIDPDKILKKISSKTKAIIPVDFTGKPVEIGKIKNMAKENKLIVIEDASHALGAIYKNKKIGGFSDMTVFSFHPVKHITTGEGGAITTNNKDFYERLKIFRTHGITKEKSKMKQYDGPWYYEMLELGYNYRLTDFQCALGISQIEKIDSNLARRREIVKIYDNNFRNMSELVVPNINPRDSNPAWHLYVIQINLDKLTVGRKVIFEALREENIGVNVHYIPVHLQPYYQRKFGYCHRNFPNAESYYSRAITLPLFPKMSDKDVNDVITAVKKVINYYKF